MRYPLPYAFARTARLLLEDDGQALTLWHDGRPDAGHLSEVMRRFGAARVLLAGALLASGFMAASGFFTAAGPLLLQRPLARVASAFLFVAGGLLADRLGAHAPQHPGLRLGA